MDHLEHLPALDPSALDEIAAVGGSELVEELVGLFLEDAPALIRSIEVSLDGGDLQTATRAAHSLKSSSLYVGAVALAQLAKHVEHTLASAPLPASRGPEELGRRFDAFRSALSKHAA